MQRVLEKINKYNKIGHVPTYYTVLTVSFMHDDRPPVSNIVEFDVQDSKVDIMTFLLSPPDIILIQCTHKPEHPEATSQDATGAELDRSDSC